MLLCLNVLTFDILLSSGKLLQIGNPKYDKDFLARVLVFSGWKSLGKLLSAN